MNLREKIEGLPRYDWQGYINTPSEKVFVKLSDVLAVLDEGSGPITPEALAARGWAFRESDQVWYAPESGGFWGYAKQLKILHGGRYWHFKIQQEVDNVTTYDIGANITTLSHLDHLLAALTPREAI